MLLLKELQSLGLDVRVLREDNTEVEIMETIDYSDSDYRYEIEGENQNRDLGKESFEANGFTKQKFDEDSGELIAEEDDAEVDFAEADENSDLSDEQ